MLTDSAVRLVNALTYKPGWSIVATPHVNRFEGCISVHIEYPAANSDRDNAFNDYAEDVLPTARATFSILSGDCDDVVLYRKLLDIIVKIETHEAREFLRVKPTMWAPFHPHRQGGMERYGDVSGDLTFGLA